MAYLRFLGSAHIEGEGGPLGGAVAQRHRLALLALLAVAAPAGVSRDKLVAHLWPEKDARRAGNLLRQGVHYVRKAAGADAIGSSGGALVLNGAVLPSDLHAFLEAVRSGRHREAVDLYGGPFLDGFHLPGAREFEEWSSLERRRMANHQRRCLEALATDAKEAGDPAGAVRWWTRRVAEEPLSARAALRLLEALVEAGNPPGAIRHARRYEALLRKELGIPPPDEIRSFVAELQRAEGAGLEPEPEVGPDADLNLDARSGPGAKPGPDPGLRPGQAEGGQQEGNGSDPDRGTRREPSGADAPRLPSTRRPRPAAGRRRPVRRVGAALGLLGGLGVAATAGIGWFLGETGEDQGVLFSASAGDRLPSLGGEDHYLQGNAYLARGFSVEAVQAAVGQYRRAVESDPLLVVAWIPLIRWQAWLAWAVGDEEAGRRAQEDLTALQALDLDDPGVRLAGTWHLYYGERRYAEALEEARGLREALPEAPEVLRLMGSLEQRFGDLEGAAESLQRALELKPRDAPLAFTLGQVQAWRGRYDEAERLFLRAAALAPDMGYAHAALEPVHLARGDTASAREAREEARERGADAWHGGRAALYSRDYPAAAARIEGHLRSVIPSARMEWYDALADAHGRAGDAEARTRWADSLLALASRLAPDPGAPPGEQSAHLGWIYRGLALLHLGDPHGALEEVRTGLAVGKGFDDALIHARMEKVAARAFARLGRTDEALEQLEASLAIPIVLSPHDLRLDPEWDPLRADPRFARMARGGGPRP